MPASQPLPALIAEAATCLRFYTRLPLPPLRAEAALPPPAFARCLRWAPLAGVAVGLCGGALLVCAAALGLPPLVAATLALGATIVASGGLHEDGLADVADGFGGGRTTGRKLEIMRDSRLGTYGALAVGLSLLLRAGCLEALWDRGGVGLALVGLVGAGAVSRGFGLLPMRLPPARRDGLGHGAGRLPLDVLATALALAAVAGVALPLLGGAGAASGLAGLALAAAAALWTTGLARRQIGGFTGDVAGACQQLCEIGMLVGLLIGEAPG